MLMMSSGIDFWTGELGQRGEQTVHDDWFSMVLTQVENGAGPEDFAAVMRTLASRGTFE